MTKRRKPLLPEPTYARSVLAQLASGVVIRATGANGPPIVAARWLVRKGWACRRMVGKRVIYRITEAGKAELPGLSGFAAGSRPVHRVFDVHLTLTIESTADRDRAADELQLEEALMQMLDSEVFDHEHAGATRCGVAFHDAESADARFVEENEIEADNKPAGAK
jgi:hypothetical protein